MTGRYYIGDAGPLTLMEAQRVLDAQGLAPIDLTQAVDLGRMKPVTREFLTKRRAIVIADLVSKVEAEDWHGAADACMDLREIDAKLELLA